MFHITSLKELNLNSNKISSIPDAITKLVHLTQLDLGNNLLENVKVLSVFARMTVCAFRDDDGIDADEVERCSESVLHGKGNRRSKFGEGDVGDQVDASASGDSQQPSVAAGQGESGVPQEAL